jgi:hypothetical protein
MLISTAVLSACGTYRYTLTRSWDTHLPRVLWCMLNPSTADASKDDPTIRKCVEFSKKWNYGSIEVVNLFAFRSTDPEALEMTVGTDVIGPENDRVIVDAASRATRIIVAWGSEKFARTRAKSVSTGLLCDRTLECLKRNTNGSPAHPLYQPYSAQPIAWVA